MIIVLLIIVAFVFWLVSSNQKNKTTSKMDNEIIYNYLFPFSLPSEAIKTIIVLKLSQNKISISWEGDTIYYNINKTIEFDFETQYECINPQNEITLITILEGGARVQDFQRGTDVKFTKTAPTTISSKNIDYVLESTNSTDDSKEVNNTNETQTNNPSEKNNKNLIIFFLIIIALLIGIIISEKNNQNANTEFPTETVVDTSQATVEVPLDTTVSPSIMVENKYFIYCSVYYRYYTPKSGINGLEPYLEEEGNYCSQIVELSEDELPRFNEKFRTSSALSSSSEYGINTDRNTFKINRYTSYEEALSDKNKNCMKELEVIF